MIMYLSCAVGFESSEHEEGIEEVFSDSDCAKVLVTLLVSNVDRVAKAFSEFAVHLNLKKM